VTPISGRGVQRSPHQPSTRLTVAREEPEREQQADWARKLGPEGVKSYQQRKNQRSLDGLPGLTGCAAALKQE